MSTNHLPPVLWEKTKWPEEELPQQEWWDVLPHKFSRFCILKARIIEISLLSEVNQSLFAQGLIEDLYQIIFEDSHVIVEFLPRSDLPIELHGEVQVDLCVYDCGMFNTAHRVYQKNGNEYVLDENGNPVLDENEPLIEGFYNNPWMAFCVDDIVLIGYDPIKIKNKKSISLNKRLILIGHSNYDGVDGTDNSNLIIPVTSGVSDYVLLDNKVIFNNNNYIYLLDNNEKNYINKNDLISIKNFFGLSILPFFTYYSINWNTCNIFTYTINFYYRHNAPCYYLIKCIQYKALRNVILNKNGNTTLNRSILYTNLLGEYDSNVRFNNVQYLDDNNNNIILIYNTDAGVHYSDVSNFELIRLFITPVFDANNNLIDLVVHKTANEGVSLSSCHYWLESQGDPENINEYSVAINTRQAHVQFINVDEAKWEVEVNSHVEYKSNVWYISNGCSGGDAHNDWLGHRYNSYNISMITRLTVGNNELIFNTNYTSNAHNHIYYDCPVDKIDFFEFITQPSSTGVTILFFNALYGICIYAVSSVQVHINSYNFGETPVSTFSVCRDTYLQTRKHNYLIESKCVQNVNGGAIDIALFNQILLDNFGTYNEPSGIVPFAPDHFNYETGYTFGTNLDVSYFEKTNNCCSLGYPFNYWGSSDLKMICIKFPLLTDNLLTHSTDSHVYLNKYSPYHCYFEQSNNFQQLLIVNDFLITDNFDPNNFGVNNCGYMPIPQD